jgi:alpha-L-arabinofuranosidase
MVLHTARSLRDLPHFTEMPRSQISLQISIASLAILFAATSYSRAAINVGLTVNAANTRATMPDTGIALHTSVYANQFANPNLPSRIAESGVDMLRYPGGSYSDLYHWSNNTALSGSYVSSSANFGQFVKDMNQSGTQGMVTVNYGSSLDYTTGGQPLEAAAWVAYANSDPSIYGTPNDINLGIDAEGNNWRTAGYWAKLRASTSSEYQTWATAAGVYNSQNTILAINHDSPVGIKYWEIGNEINGNGFTGTQWEYDLHAPYNGGNSSDNTGRKNNALLSPTAYATKITPVYLGDESGRSNNQDWSWSGPGGEHGQSTDSIGSWQSGRFRDRTLVSRW